MRRRILTWIVLSLLIVAGLFIFFRAGDRSAVVTNQSSPAVVTNSVSHADAEVIKATVSESTSPVLISGESASSTSASKKDFLDYRLSNTKKTSDQLLRDDGAIILENALIETGKPLDFAIPEKLRAVGDPGSYIVQSRGPVDAAFRRALAEAGAEIVSYIPNNAFLVRADAATANRLSSNPEMQSVLAYEPVYKLKSELLPLALEGKSLPPGTKLNLLVFTDAYSDVTAKLKAMGWNTLAEDSSPFGRVITVDPGADWTSVAVLSGVQLLETAQPRAKANDLSRVRLGVATDSIVSTNYLGLTGTNILVGINDSGVDQLHPDLTGRVFANNINAFLDTSGHGTHVAGIIAGNGTVSATVTNARGSINVATNGHFRGMAPGAKLFAQTIGSGLGTLADSILQENTVLTNALISNNSWTYVGSSTYSLAAASYDAAVRDSLPGRTGSQPVLYVFAAGNSGGGNDSGLGGNPGSLTAPGTAKNVLTVGAIELARDITNIVTKITKVSGSTNQFSTNVTTPWRNMTSSGNQVAGFSARGNVGIGTEGDFGRFKPDVVAPGTFVISTRSSMWDEIAYYNPTNHHYSTFRNQIVESNSFHNYAIFLPDNAVGFTVSLYANDNSPDPFPDLPIFVRHDDYPLPYSTAEAVGTNFVGVPPTLAAGPGAFVGQNWYYTILNTNREDISYNILTDVITTNDLGDYYTVLSNLNNSLTGTNQQPPHYYRYESGTSMSAAGVSGTLALMQQFFEQGMAVTNSPAMMKALLINGARSVGNVYDFQVRSTINYQGWGLVKLNNTLPPGITNAFTHSGPASMQLFDQSPTNALATGFSQTRLIKLDESGRTLPLRITLAWTDPPGNPVAGVKLVNDLDLVITNLDTGDIFLGNDIPGASTFTFPWETNAAPNIDSVNNVENVYLAPALGTNYSVTVVGRRVNVNAVTAHTNDIVQDYALVISSGNGEATNAVSMVGPTLALVFTNQPSVTHVTTTNSPDGEAPFSSALLMNQRVGANSPMLVSTNGGTNQWRFYVLTNSTTFTNASFLASQQTDLSTPRMGVFASGTDNSTRRFADIDMYVSQNPALTNLDPLVISNSFKSLGRNDLSGDEFITFADSSQGQIYYVGVKSEDQMAAQFEFWGIFSLFPLGEEDANGFVRAYPMMGFEIPDGSPSQPGGTRFVSITRSSSSGDPESVRRIIVTNNITHENFGDIIGSIEHNLQAVVLNNHRSIEPPLIEPGPYGFLYDDSGEGDYEFLPDPNPLPPDGPGTFESFTGLAPGGTWYFTFSDDALTQTGRVNDVRLRVERQCALLNGGCTETVAIGPNSWRYFSRNIPVNATNFTVCITTISANPQPLQLYIRKDKRPTQTAYDYTMTINPNGCLSIDKFDLPPLTSGRYFIGVFNGNPGAQTFTYTSTIQLGEPPTALPFNSIGGQQLLDDAVTNFTTFVTDSLKIAQLEVGLRMDHPRVSDLAVTLISPNGTRVLLVENRGGLDTNGFGSSLTVTNFLPVGAGGGAATVITNIDTGSTAGSVTIDYDFFNAPDQMTVYYEGVLLFDTGMTSGSARLNLDYGPGASTLIEIRMNEFGNTNSTTLWEYTVSSYNTANSYLVFTENTNRTPTPIPVKFALPPFVGTFGTSNNISEFEPPPALPGVVAGDYVNPATPDGWTVLPTNRVTVITNSANLGVQSLALRSGTIQRTLVTVPGRSYRLGFAYRKAASLDGIVSWWPGQSNSVATDIVDGNVGALQGGVTFSPGIVGSTFNFAAVSQKIVVPDAPNLRFTNAMTVEAWVNPRTVGGYPREIVSKWEGGFNQRSYTFSISTTGLGYFHMSSDGGFGSVTVVYSATPIPLNTWTHVAGVYDGANLRYYVNGVLQNTTAWPLGIFAGNSPLVIGSTLSSGSAFDGLIDEPTVFRRALTGAEIQSIYSAGAAGKCGMVVPPDVCPSLGAQIYVPGVATNTFLGTTNWQQGGLIFTATAANTIVNLAPLNANSPSGVWVDSFVLYENSGPRYVLPEESLDVLLGENAFGTWKLEIWDSRTGATNTATTLVDWQLQFVFQTNTPPPIILPPSEPQTNDIPVGGISYLVVDVPAWATRATNTLVFASGSVSVWFNQNTPPVGTVLPDYSLIGPGVTGVAILTTNAFPAPQLLPGQRYYIGITNNTAAPITYSFRVDYDMTELTNNVPVTSAHGPGSLPRYFFFDVSTNALAVSFRMFNMDGNMDLVARRGTPLPTLTSFDYGSFNPGLNNEDIVVFTNSAPVPLAAGRWYLGVFNNDVANVNYDIVAREFTNLPPSIITLNNGIAYGNTNSGVGLTNDFYRYVVSGSAVGVRFEITNMSANMMLVARKGFPPPDAGSFDYSNNNPGLADEVIVIFTNTAPVNLTPGDWFITAINVSGGPATYSIKATEYGPITTLFNGFARAGFNDNTKFSTDWYRYDVTTNAVRVHFEILNPTGDMTLALRKGPLPPLADALVNDYISANAGVVDELIVVLTNSTPVVLSAGDWYLSAINVSGAPVFYSVRATEFGPDTIVTLTNAIAYVKTNSGAGNATDYYRYVVTTNAVRAQFEIFGMSGNMTLVARKGLPLPGLGLFDYLSANIGTNDEVITLFTNTAPVVLSPGEWYLAAINLSGGAASYSIMATEWATTGRPIVITDQFLSSNSFCITWTSLPGVRYHVEGRTDLNSPAWTTVSPTITATGYSTTWCIALPSPYHFFRVAEDAGGNTSNQSGLPAFPGAEGAGAFAIGGRGGDVYHVTNLNDDGPGSLRFGLRSFNRTIVFDISGTIDLSSDLNITRSFITVAGQTAPGDGITLRGRSVSINGADNVVLRFLRFRSGDLNCPVFQGDSFSFDLASNSIVDHVSASWSIDETLSATDSTNITVQWSLITESLNNSCHIEGTHGFGSLLRYGHGQLSFHHNLYAANNSRNPRLGDNLTLDFVNNVIFNWGDRAGYSGDDLVDNPAGYTNRLNYVGNYLIAGLDTLSPDTAFTGGATNTWIYQSGNRIDNNFNLVLDGADTGWGMFADQYTPVASPFPVQSVLTDPANLAYERVLAFSGASFKRDVVDYNLIKDIWSVQSGTIIDSVTLWPILASTPTPADTDQDGMPDYWETTLALNPAVAGNNNDRDGDGYTDLEEYLNWLAAPHATCFTNTFVDIDLAQFLQPLSGSGAIVYNVANGTNGSVILLGNGRTARFTPNAPLTGLASFTFGFTDNTKGITVSPLTVSVLVNAVTPPPATPATITSTVVSTNGVTIGWISDAGRQFQAQWATNIAPPIVWNTFTNIITSAGTNYTFLDDGVQAGGFGPMRFYRLLNYP